MALNGPKGIQVFLVQMLTNALTVANPKHIPQSLRAEAKADVVHRFRYGHVSTVCEFLVLNPVLNGVGKNPTQANAILTV